MSRIRGSTPAEITFRRGEPEDQRVQKLEILRQWANALDTQDGEETGCCRPLVNGGNPPVFIINTDHDLILVPGGSE